jgi:hypothetical protein
MRDFVAGSSMGLFLIIGAHWLKILPQNSKRGQLNECTVYVYCLGVLFSPLWPKFVLRWPASVSS